MESILKADIFFVIATISVVFVSLALLVVLAYAVSVLRDIKRITKRVRRGATDIVADVDMIREGMKRGADAVGDIVKDEISSVTLRKVVYVIVGIIIGIFQQRSGDTESTTNTKK